MKIKNKKDPKTKKFFEEASVLKLTLIMYSSLLLDYITTIIALNLGAEEANPIPAYFFSLGTFGFIINMIWGFTLIFLYAMMIKGAMNSELFFVKKLKEVKKNTKSKFVKKLIGKDDKSKRWVIALFGVSTIIALEIATAIHNIIVIKIMLS